MDKKIIDSPVTYWAIDFDGTIVSWAFPAIGKVEDEQQEVIDTMRRVAKNPQHRIIIWTCRAGKQLDEMRDWLLKNKVPFDYINENPEVSFGSSKVVADYYVDDRVMRIEDFVKLDAKQVSG